MAGDRTKALDNCVSSSSLDALIVADSSSSEPSPNESRNSPSFGSGPNTQVSKFPSLSRIRSKRSSSRSGSASKSPNWDVGSRRAGTARDWADGSESERQSSKSFGDRTCKCMAGAAADCTALCCCPFTLLHVLALLCIRAPASLCRKALARLKKNKPKLSLVDKEDYQWTPSLTPCPSSKENPFQIPPNQNLAHQNVWQLLEEQSGFWYLRD